MSDTVDPSEIDALLRELESVSTTPTSGEKESGRPFSSRRCGSGNVDLVVSRFPGRTGQALFSTYADTSNNDSRRTAVPLWERLPPLRPIGSDGNGSPKAPAGRGNALLRPILGGGTVAASLPRASVEEVRSSLSPLKNAPHGDLRLPQQEQKQNQQQHEQVPPEISDVGEQVYREANFLPIMCARYMSPAGLTPRARWGHTLTPMQGHKLLMFGGMDIEQGETSDLFEYDTHHVAWDPVFVVNGTSPTPRTNHAACSYEGRWLYISGGTTESGSRILGDLWCYDTCTQEWKCLWEYSSSSVGNKNEPTPRFGHSMILRDDRLYIFGGRTLKRDQSEARSTAIVCMSSTEIYVFSLTSFKWKKRIHVSKGGVTAEESKAPTAETIAATATTAAAAAAKTTKTATMSVSKLTVERPANRCHHAACLLSDRMYINGGVGENGSTLSDTWMFDFREQRWVVLHDGGSADAFPRQKHSLFVCGEALLVVGGCSASGHSGRITVKYHNFVAVLPLQGDVAPCWIPVAMGNVAIVAPNKKSFGAAFSGGFVHVFGGMCGSEPASNAMVRFLAADGCLSTDARGTVAANEDALRSMMRHMRDGGGSAAYDTYVLPRSWNGDTAVDTLNNRQYGLHRVLAQQRAPKFWEDLTRCRMEQVRPSGKRSTETSINLGIGTDAPAPASDGAYQNNVVAYYTEGNSRVQGLSLPLSGDQLHCLLDYIYWGEVRHRILSEFEEEENGEDVDAPVRKSVAQEEANVIQVLRRAAELYELSPLLDICDALLSRSRKKLRQAQERSIKQLQEDLLSLLKSGTGASVTVLFVDPHTKQQVAHSLHPFILMASNSFFNDLLRPLLSGEKTSFQVGPVAAKVRAGGRGPSQTRRGILVGPVSVPYLAVQPLLQYFYTQRLSVPREAVFATMLGAHLLDVPPLQAFCEAILAREEVNYDTSGQFYSLAGKYQAALLQEVALLTAVLGYAEVRHSPSYKALSEKEAREIEAVALELGATSWIAPPQPVSEVKPAAVYQARWNMSSP